jgi:hypothetical protein
MLLRLTVLVLDCGHDLEVVPAVVLDSLNVVAPWCCRWGEGSRVWGVEEVEVEINC